MTPDTLTVYHIVLTVETTTLAEADIHEIARELGLTWSDVYGYDSACTKVAVKRQDADEAKHAKGERLTRPLTCRHSYPSRRPRNPSSRIY